MLCRWQNYLLTLVVLIVLSVLIYHPCKLVKLEMTVSNLIRFTNVYFLSALFLSFLTLVAILLMAVGKYYSHTKTQFLLRKRVRPHVELLDQDAQHFVS